MFEKDLEIQKINLSLREDFNLIDAFGILDEDGRGDLNPQELHVALRKLDIPAT
jgi:Ca2+-binding EF-hand superfamily protein